MWFWVQRTHPELYCDTGHGGHQQIPFSRVVSIGVSPEKLHIALDPQKFDFHCFDKTAEKVNLEISKVNLAFFPSMVNGFHVFQVN